MDSTSPVVLAARHALFADARHPSPAANFSAHRSNVSSATRTRSPPRKLELDALSQVNESANPTHILSATNTPQTSSHTQIHNESSRLRARNPNELPDVFSDGADSTRSEYIRHRRYANPMTAYQYVSDPYDHAREAARQERFLDLNRRVGKAFVPTGLSRPLDTPSRMQLGDCVASVYRTVLRDWFEALPLVVSTAEDLIVVYFQQNCVRDRSVLVSYMNGAVHRNEAVQEYHLYKVPKAWNVATGDGYYMFTFRPPWVRNRDFLPSK